VPVVIGAMLGPLAEQHRRALLVAGGRWWPLLSRPPVAPILAWPLNAVLSAGRAGRVAPTRMV
jgi:TctA family transporter